MSHFLMGAGEAWRGVEGGGKSVYLNRIMICFLFFLLPVVQKYADADIRVFLIDSSVDTALLTATNIDSLLSFTPHLCQWMTWSGPLFILLL